MTKEITPTVATNPADNFRLSTDVAGVCREIVTKTALQIQGKKYVRVEGWESIALAHGCFPSIQFVEKVEGGYRAVAELKSQTGIVLASAEGFVGEDEATWFGGERSDGSVLPKRPDYAIRAMAQTRALSRVCRTVFAHVVVLMDAGLETTPADEVPLGGFDNDQIERRQEAREAKATEVRERGPHGVEIQDADPYGHHGEIPPVGKDEEKTYWADFRVPFGKNRGISLGALPENSLHWYAHDWLEEKLKTKGASTATDRDFIEALMQYRREHKALKEGGHL